MELSASRLPPSGQVKARRALLYNTGTYKPSGSKWNPPISRKSIEEKTAIEARQQRRYDQVVEEAHGPIREVSFSYYQDQKTGRLKSFQRLVERERGPVLTSQLPNRYRAVGSGSSRGMLRKVSRILIVANQSFLRGEANFATNNRRYYRSFRAFIKAALHGKATVGFYPSPINTWVYIVEVVP